MAEERGEKNFRDEIASSRVLEMEKKLAKMWEKSWGKNVAPISRDFEITGRYIRRMYLDEGDTRR